MTSDRDKVNDFLADLEADIAEGATARRNLKKWGETVLEGLRDYASHLSYVPERRRRPR